jgi:hypothetical protein
MNKSLFIFMIALVLLTSVYAADVVRDVPSQARQGSTINVTLMVRGGTLNDRVVIGEELPEGAMLRSWKVSGAAEGDSFSFTQQENSLIWEFVATNPSPFVTYEVFLPFSGKEVVFDAVYAFSSGEHGNPKDAVSLLPPLPAPPPALAPALPVTIERPTLPHPAPEMPLLLIGSIFAVSIGLVYVIERSARRIAQKPFGHHTIEFIMHLFEHFERHKPQPVRVESSSTIMEEALQAAELAQVVDHVQAPNKPSEAQVWSSPIFHR